MPKDKNLAKHKSRFEVRGGVINEFEFQQGHGALTEEDKDRFARQEEERRVREGEAEQPPQSAAKTRSRKIGAKKWSAKKASDKKIASKMKSGKGTAKKSGSRKAGKKGAAKKGGTRRR